MRPWVLAMLFLFGCEKSPLQARDAEPSDGLEAGLQQDDSNVDGGYQRDALTPAPSDAAAETEDASLSYVHLIVTDPCMNPCTLSSEASRDVAIVRYLADQTWPLGEAGAPDFVTSYRFSNVGTRTISAIGFDFQGREVARDERTLQIMPEASAARRGAWLWYVDGTGYTHQELAQRLRELGFGRVFIKVADGNARCDDWPELCDRSVPSAYQAAGLEAWAWSYNYPGSEEAQADALEQAATTGYDGYVLDLEVEFDGSNAELTRLLESFHAARERVRRSGPIGPQWPIYATTWGNPEDHGMRVDIIDRYVDAHMPQTYLEVWGSSYMADPTRWIHAGTCEYRALGAQKPIHHILSSEYGEITPAQLQEAMDAAGAEGSIWRIPGGTVPDSIWDDWDLVDWRGTRDVPVSCP